MNGPGRSLRFQALRTWQETCRNTNKERLKNNAPNLLVFSPRTCVGIQLKELATIRSIPPWCETKILRSLSDPILEALLSPSEPMSPTRQSPSSIPAPPLRVLETCLYCQDLEAAREFYGDLLRLEEISYREGRHIFYRSGQGTVLIFDPVASRENPERLGSQCLPPHGAGEPVHMALCVPGLALPGWRSYLTRNQIPIEQEILWPDGARSLYIRDPAGNSIELATSDLWTVPPPVAEENQSTELPPEASPGDDIETSLLNLGEALAHATGRDRLEIQRRISLLLNQ